MADFNKPTIDDTYVNVLPDVRGNQEALAVMFNGVSVENIPINAVNYSGGVFGLWNGSSFEATAVAIGGGGTGGKTAAEARANLGVSSTTESDTTYMAKSANGSDIDSKSTFRTEIDVYSTDEVYQKTETYTQTEVDDKTATATQAEAVAGTDNTKLMTPLRVDQALDQLYQEETIGISGNMTVGSATFKRTGNTVSVTGFYVHSTSSTALTADNSIPVWARPSTSAPVVYDASASKVSKVIVSSVNNRLQFSYFDWTGAGRSTATTDDFSITYSL